MIRAGTLPTIAINGRPRITPEAVACAEAGPLAVRPRRRRKVETIPEEVREMLDV